MDLTAYLILLLQQAAAVVEALIFPQMQLALLVDQAVVALRARLTVPGGQVQQTKDMQAAARKQMDLFMELVAVAVVPARLALMEQQTVQPATAALE
jgi:hypothetical protein